MHKLFALLACALSCSLLTVACGVEVDDQGDIASEAAPLVADTAVVSTPPHVKQCDSKGNTCADNQTCCYDIFGQWSSCEGPGHICPQP